MEQFFQELGNGQRPAHSAPIVVTEQSAPRHIHPVYIYIALPS